MWVGFTHGSLRVAPATVGYALCCAVGTNIMLYDFKIMCRCFLITRHWHSGFWCGYSKGRRPDKVWAHDEASFARAIVGRHVKNQMSAGGTVQSGCVFIFCIVPAALYLLCGIIPTITFALLRQQWAMHCVVPSAHDEYYNTVTKVIMDTTPPPQPSKTTPNPIDYCAKKL